jgi:hypothetical protein
MEVDKLVAFVVVLFILGVLLLSPYVEKSGDSVSIEPQITNEPMLPAPPLLPGQKRNIVGLAGATNFVDPCAYAWQSREYADDEKCAADPVEHGKYSVDYNPVTEKLTINVPPTDTANEIPTFLLGYYTVKNAASTGYDWQEFSLMFPGIQAYQFDNIEGNNKWFNTEGVTTPPVAAKGEAIDIPINGELYEDFDNYVALFYCSCDGSQNECMFQANWQCNADRPGILNGRFVMTPFLPNDVNDDGIVDFLDLEYARRFSSGSRITQVLNKVRAHYDANNDGDVTAHDVSRMNDIQLGLNTCGLSSCDFDGDGRFSYSDSEELKQAVVEMYDLTNDGTINSGDNGAAINLLLKSISCGLGQTIFSCDVDGDLSDVNNIFSAVDSQRVGNTVNQWGNDYKALFHMDEYIGAEPLVDTSGRKQHGTCYGECPPAAEGKLGTGLNFDGTSKGVMFGGLASGTDFTIAAWVKPDVWGQRHTIIANRDSHFVSGRDGFQLFVNDPSDPNGVIGLRTFDGSGAELIAKSITGAIIPNQWNHIVAVINKGTGKVTFFRNGQDVTDTNDNDYVTTASDAEPWVIGKLKDDIEPWHGGIDEVIVHAFALDTMQVEQLYRAQAGLLTHLPLDGNLLDFSLRQSAPTCTECPSSTAGKVDEGFHFDGVNDYLRASQMDFGKKFTIATWIKPDTLPSGGEELTIMSNHQPGHPALAEIIGFRMFVTNTGALAIGAIDPAGSNLQYFTAPGLITPANWQHITVAVDKGKITLYVDGSSEKVVNINIFEKPISNKPWTVGAWTNGDNVFDGVIDDFRVYGTTLFPGDVECLPAHSQGQSCTPTLPTLYGPLVTQPECGDGIDNDLDGLTDINDDSCTSYAGSDEGLTPCEDSIDNDQDGTIDTNDPGCFDNTDTSEHSAVQCDNGIDDDNNGLCDFAGCTIGGMTLSADPSCDSLTDDTEEVNPECGDGVDNDDDGLADLIDPGCADSSDTSERDTNVACDDGQDNDGDGFTDSGAGNDPGCSSASDTDEQNSAVECDDGQDNDGDGRTDYKADGSGDFQCSSPAGTTEADNSLFLHLPLNSFTPGVADSGTTLGTFPDASGRGHNGILRKVDTVTTFNPYIPSGEGIQGSGTIQMRLGDDSYIRVVDHADFDFGAGQDFTLMAWIRPTSNPGQSSQYGIISKVSTSAITTPYYKFEMRKISANVITAGIDDRTPIGSSGSGFTSPTTTPIPLDTWTHVAAVYDRDDKVTVYINGKQQGQEPIADQSGNLGNNENIGIGFVASSSSSTSNNGFFDGYMDEIMVFNRAVGAEEVAYLCDRQKGSAC